VTILKYPLRSFSELESYVFLDSLFDLGHLNIKRYNTEDEEVKHLQIYRSIFEKTKGNVRDLIANYWKDFGSKVNTTS
jgi:S-adenosylmethionine:tRNA-ribosyltransferase-isomerase (queuine synthetase)